MTLKAFLGKGLVILKVGHQGRIQEWWIVSVTTHFFQVEDILKENTLLQLENEKKKFLHAEFFLICILDLAIRHALACSTRLLGVLAFPVIFIYVLSMFSKVLETVIEYIQHK